MISVIISSAYSRSPELHLADCKTSRHTCAKPNVARRDSSPAVKMAVQQSSLCVGSTETILYGLIEFCLSTAKHNKKSVGAEPAEFSRAWGLIAWNLLFAKVKQNISNKTAIANGQNEPIEKPTTTYLYNPCLRSTGKAERISIVELLPFSSMSAGNCPLKYYRKEIYFAYCPLSTANA